MGTRGYRKFHGLTRTAFGKSITRKHLLIYPQLEELTAELEMLLEDGGVGVLTGEVGIGKTTALRSFLNGLEDRSCQVCYHGSSRHSAAILQGLVEGLGAAPSYQRTALLRQISGLVERLWAEQRKKTFVIVDDAQLVEDGLLEDLRLLTNYEMDSADPMVLLLVGHPALRVRLRRPIHLALWDRVRMVYRLEGLSSEETSEYLERHLEAAGGSGDTFTPEAREEIFEHSQGIPRRINQLALLSLKKGALRKVTPLDAELVASVVSLYEN